MFLKGTQNFFSGLYNNENVIHNENLLRTNFHIKNIRLGDIILTLMCKPGRFPCH